MANEERPRPSILEPPKAPNACPECGHTPKTTTGCFSATQRCFDWSGREVLCLCVNEAHYSREAMY